MGRWIEMGLLMLLVVVLGFTGGDWVVWRVRGGPMDHVVVTRLVVAPLKGNREEYYPDGQVDEVCSQSLLPWSGAGACWKLRQKRVVIER